MEQARKKWLAVLLSLLTPGAGHLYLGWLRLGLGLFGLSFLPWLLFILCWVGCDSGFGLASGLWLASASVVWLGAAGHALAVARRPFTKRFFNLASFYALLVLLGLGGQLGLFQLVATGWFRVHIVQSDGMVPNLVAGDWLRVDLRARSRENLARGAVVLIADPYNRETHRVLRVVGLPGDQVTLGPDGLTIGGTPVPRRAETPGSYQRLEPGGNWTEQPYAYFTETLGGRPRGVIEASDVAARRQGRFEIPPGQVLLLGDNRFLAQDGTAFGPISFERVLGVVFEVWFSRDPRTGAGRPERRGLAVQ